MLAADRAPRLWASHVALPLFKCLGAGTSCAAGPGGVSAALAQDRWRLLVPRAAASRRGRPGQYRKGRAHARRASTNELCPVMRVEGDPRYNHLAFSVEPARRRSDPSKCASGHGAGQAACPDAHGEILPS